jgi:RimJ/RimL family protein N-acetyltransferase
MQDGQSTPPHANPVIRSEHIYLRPPERSDLSSFVRWFADAETVRHLAARAPFSMAMEEKWFAQVVESQGKGSYHFVICVLEDGRAIGVADLRAIDLENGKAEFGITIGEKGEWNKGYGTEALRAISDFGFGSLRLERIALEVYEDNPRAMRSYEKAGFRHEGRLRKAHFREGSHSDVLVMALLRDEWLALERRTSWQINFGDA